MLPWGLSMLWENDDPHVALRERFGFAGLPAVAGWTAIVLDQVWGLTATGCPRMVISDQNAVVWVETGRGGLVVKWSRAPERFPGLDATARLVRLLERQGVPVAAPVAASNGQDRVVQDGPRGPLSIGVLPELSGDWLDVADETAVRAAGACLAQVHEALRGQNDERLVRPGVDEPLRSEVGRWLTDHDPGRAPAASLRLAALLSQLPDLDDEPQLVHNDFRAANLLTRDSTIVGVLDFDDVGRQHRVADLARASVYLATRFTDWHPTPPAVRRQLRAGYESVRPLAPAERGWLEALVLWDSIRAVPAGADPGGWAEAV